MSATLHCIYDPLCGWCFGAAPLLKAAAAVPGLHTCMHAGGMMAGPGRQAGSAQLRSFILPHAARITRLTGQTFGPAYFDLAQDSAAQFDSEPPITAVLAAESLGQGLPFLDYMQQEHFQNGANIGDPAVLRKLARDLNLDGFEAAYERAEGAPTQRHIDESRSLLHKLGGAGFPTFALESQQGWRILNSAAYFGNPQGWAEMLTASL